MPPKSVAHEETTLQQLRTILLLEETLGVKGIRQLRHVIRDEEGRDVVDEIIRGAADTARDVDDVIHQWSRKRRGGAAPVQEVPAGLDREEVVSSLIELKEDEAAMLRRASQTAPDPEMADRLREIADREARTAERLRQIL